MKLSSLHRRKSRIELSMTSMIDVVFLLLIFFLVTTTFIRPEKQLQSSISPEKTNAAQKKSVLEPAIVYVKIAANGKPAYKLGAIETVDLRAIGEVLKGFDDKSEGAFVRVDDDVPFEWAAEAIGACRAAGFNSVTYIPNR